jgi:hypothetical protein
MTETNAEWVRDMAQRRDPPVPVVSAKRDAIRSEFVLI